MILTDRQRRSIQRVLSPPKPKYAPRGLEEWAREMNISYASLRAKLRKGMTHDQAAKHCIDNGLTYIPRGTTRPGWGRRKAELSSSPCAGEKSV